jgi:hypothetical protein
MKRFTAALTTIVLGSMLLTTFSMADAKKGHRIYKKKMHRVCKFPGSTFARKHTQEEWEKINDKGQFREETQKICPALKLAKLNDKQWNDLYDFTYKFGIGGEIPNGCDPK